jgi:hypothetical protein
MLGRGSVGFNVREEAGFWAGELFASSAGLRDAQRRQWIPAHTAAVQGLAGSPPSQWGSLRDSVRVQPPR